MQFLVKLILVMATTMASSGALAAALCPVNSCNPHNGCIEGCSVIEVTGKAACNSENPKAAEKEAYKNATDQAYKSCGHNFFLRSPWAMGQVNVGDKCEIHVQAVISCY